jgi:hypothetical protein
MTEPNSGKLIAVIGLGNMGSATANSRPAAQEPVEHVEEFGDAGELGGIDRCGGLVGAVRPVLACA